MMSENIKDYDIVIIGGGPAGLAAGLYAARGNMKTVILEKLIPGGQLNNTLDVENYPGIDHVTGPQIAQAMEEQTKRFGCEIVNTCTISEVELSKGRHLIKSDRGIYRAQALIVATGSEYRKLNVPGEKEYSGKGVSYCAVCDGAFFKEKKLVVIGGGDSAVEEGNFLTKFASSVTIMHRRDKFRAEKIIQDRAFKNPKINVIWNTVVNEIKGDVMSVVGLKVKDVVTNEVRDFPCDGIFIYVGLDPNTQLFKDKLKMDSTGRLETNERMETSVSGVYAAGDVRETPLKQAVTAAADGSLAATMAIEYIESLHDSIVKAK